MVEWTSASVLASQQVAINKIELVLLGMYAWECIASSGFDYSVWTRKKPFKWPILVYWLSKYSMLWFIISINICFQVTHRIACQSISIFINLSGRTATAAASNLLLLRTIALWKWNPWVVWPMYALSVGQWALYLHNVFIVREVWSEADKSCIVQSVGDTPIKVQFIYTMFFDLIVLILALRALLRQSRGSNLWKLLFYDGLSYFVIAFTCYLAATIMAFLDLNATTIFMVADPATILAATAANRSFVRILTWGSSHSLQASGGTSLTATSATVRFGNGHRRSLNLSTNLTTTAGADSLRAQLPVLPSHIGDQVEMKMEVLASVSYPDGSPKPVVGYAHSIAGGRDDDDGDVDLEARSVKALPYDEKLGVHDWSAEGKGPWTSSGGEP